MYKKAFLFRFLFCLTITAAFCQDYYYGEYDISIDKEKLSLFLSKKDFDPFQKSMFLKMANEVNRTQLALYFDKESSLFEPIEQLIVGDYNLDLAKAILIFIDVEDAFYYDSKNCSFYKKRGKEHLEHLVKIDPQPLDWKILNQEKTVGGLVYKRASTSFLLNSVKYGIDAWFCPSIPVQFGPGSFYGLPGLITEVYATSDEAELNYSFILKKIKRNKKIGVVKIPLERYKVYSEEESQSIFEGALEYFRN